jgi:AcrR family transcriptional regulator
MSRPTSPDPSPVAIGLRERKKLKTRWSIQDHAMRLFAERGYEQTTVDEIAAAAEVSPSTFFRYFKTKEDVVLRDEYDDMLIEVFAMQPPDRRTVPAIRQAIADSLAVLDEDEWAALRQRTGLIMSTPALRMRQMDDMADFYAVLADAVATRTGRSADDIECRAVAGAVLGVCTSVALSWLDDGGTGDLAAALDRGLAELENGFTL